MCRYMLPIAGCQDTVNPFLSPVFGPCTDRALAAPGCKRISVEHKLICLRVTTPNPSVRCRWQSSSGHLVPQAADEGDGYDLIFYGDSLTEMWRGTRSDQPFAPRSAMPGAATLDPKSYAAWRHDRAPVSRTRA